ncbi:MAG: trehalase family glycosidase [Lautropia sp.]|nr:trehalase family glycosidase [Lautropia sp.]
MKLHTHKADTLRALLAQEDTDGSKTITVEDTGPRDFTVTGTQGGQLRVQGTWRLANLLQELWLSADGEIDSALIEMAPLARIDHLMRTHYWQVLTRRIDEAGLLASLTDEKRASDRQYLYVPAADEAALAYYRRITAAHPQIEVVPLPAPETLTEADHARIDERPGLLALKVDAGSGQPLPYVVPGGRFNEMYGWDSYFIALGLLHHQHHALARGMLENMAYQIRYYGRMLNANRSYYLRRSQPPFYTPYLRAFLDAVTQAGGAGASASASASTTGHDDTAWANLPEGWLAEHLGIAIDEYQRVWMDPATHLTAIGLNRYYGEGKGRPKETEPGHFDFELAKYARKHGLDVREFERRYDNGDIIEPALDQYFVHDRSMRESGLDTTTRFDDCCADLACVDLNSILYRVETDIADLIEQHAGGRFEYDGHTHTPAEWRARAEQRKTLMKQYLWSDADGSYHDYNVRTGQPQPFVSASNLLPLWAGCCTAEDARRLVASQLPQLLHAGGIASTGPVDKNQPGPERQWDAPYGWAPHQIMIWEGLARYGFADEARRAARAWLQMLVQAAVDYNGLITEKFNVEKRSHKVDAEYGNVGARFEYLPAGGFGWTNTSFLLGLGYLNDDDRAQLDALSERGSIVS